MASFSIGFIFLFPVQASGMLVFVLKLFCFFVVGIIIVVTNNIGAIVDIVVVYYLFVVVIVAVVVVVVIVAAGVFLFVSVVVLGGLLRCGFFLLSLTFSTSNIGALLTFFDCCLLLGYLYYIALFQLCSI